MVASLSEGTGMKTIDEVISFLEDRQKTEDWNVRDDAIQHLREFKELIKMWNDKLDKEQENPPLTWEQLKQMEGKPVWVEMDGYKPNWGIVMNQDKRNGRLMLCGYDEAAIRMEINKEGEGNGWQAYRKEK